MTIPPIPKEIEDLVSPEEWKGPPGKVIIGHRSAMMEYPENTRRLLEKGIFTFSDLIAFDWQEIQAILIHGDKIEKLADLGFNKTDFHRFDAQQMIEVVHHINAFDKIVKEGVVPSELGKFSAYQLRLVLEYPETIASILKYFEGVDEFLTLRWNWIEEMLLRPEDALSLLEHGVKWHQLDHLPDWDFGWFLAHRKGILILLDGGTGFETIARLDALGLRQSPLFAPLIEKGLCPEDLKTLDFYQLFMILVYRAAFMNVIGKGYKDEFLNLSSSVMEILLQDQEKLMTLREADPNFLHELKGIKPLKVRLLMEFSDHFKQLTRDGVSLIFLRPLMDSQFRLVLENPGEFILIADFAKKYRLPLDRSLDIDLDTARLINANSGKVEVLLELGLNFDDLTRYPLILPQVIQYAERIADLDKKGIPPEDIFHLSTDQIIYAFARFPLLDILPKLNLTIRDLQIFQIGEFKEVLSNLKALSILKKGGVDLRGVSEIRMPHLGVLLKYPEYVLSLIRKGIPIYKLARLHEHKLEVLLRDPLTPEAQMLIQELLR